MQRKSSLILILICFVSLALDLKAQNSDTTVLPVDTFVSLVKRHHPIALQALIIRRQAQANRLKASGSFDPKLFSEINQKQFSEKDYYQLQNSGIEFPAWYGLKAKAGYELNDGIFLDNQNTVPGSGLWYADVSITLGKGLLMDERRAMLKQARLLEESAEFEVDLALNDLLENALGSYWQWYEAYREMSTMKQALAAAEFRFKAVRRQAIIGDKSMVDTLEAAIQVQDRSIRLKKARANFITKRNELATYLWLEGLVPLDIREASKPEFSQLPVFNILPENWFVNHPSLNFYRLKLEGLEIERRLKAESLKPQLDLNYKFLNQPAANDFFAQYSPDNYNWGLKASFPLFIRKGRGDLKNTKLKIEDNNLELDLKRVALRNKVQAMEQELILSLAQLIETRSMVTNHRSLLAAENNKFRNGESSLFLVNSRELKYIDAQIKQFELESKLNSVRAKLLAAAGALDD
jgi:outer membrane protein TolC